ncbi:hypothetical protein GCM10010095_75870 [Streptomyces anthocyanicus]|uniref:hypothetical protein n=1 Tax=Streptomyces anthocyanicus TaxID=68174 RepID=UPI001670ECF3|nr:hypothetical protein [Streptomyces anthocyanicus]GGL79668.1 hypothetical protein GCM10010095_75870 [Streptomyces anthocyanicus]
MLVAHRAVHDDAQYVRAALAGDLPEGVEVFHRPMARGEVRQSVHCPIFGRRLGGRVDQPPDQRLAQDVVVVPDVLQHGPPVGGSVEDHDVAGVDVGTDVLDPAAQSPAGEHRVRGGQHVRARGALEKVLEAARAARHLGHRSGLPHGEGEEQAAVLQSEGRVVTAVPDGGLAEAGVEFLAPVGQRGLDAPHQRQGLGAVVVGPFVLLLVSVVFLPGLHDGPCGAGRSHGAQSAHAGPCDGRRPQGGGQLAVAVGVEAGFDQLLGVGGVTQPQHLDALAFSQVVVVPEVLGHGQHQMGPCRAEVDGVGGQRAQEVGRQGVVYGMLQIELVRVVSFQWQAAPAGGGPVRVQLHQPGVAGGVLGQQTQGEGGGAGGSRGHDDEDGTAQAARGGGESPLPHLFPVLAADEGLLQQAVAVLRLAVQHVPPAGFEDHFVDVLRDDIGVAVYMDHFVGDEQEGVFVPVRGSLVRWGAYVGLTCRVLRSVLVPAPGPPPGVRLELGRCVRGVRAGVLGIERGFVHVRASRCGSREGVGAGGRDQRSG